MDRRTLLKKAATIGATFLLPIKIATEETVDAFQPLMERVAQATTPGAAWGLVQRFYDAGLLTLAQRQYLIEWVGMREQQGGF